LLFDSLFGTELSLIILCSTISNENCYWCLADVSSSSVQYVVSRGAQYVHWVMHKCIMVKVGGEQNTRKVCKKQVNLCKTGGKFVKVGGNNNFRETGGNVLKQGK